MPAHGGAIGMLKTPEERLEAMKSARKELVQAGASQSAIIGPLEESIKQLQATVDELDMAASASGRKSGPNSSQTVVGSNQSQKGSRSTAADIWDAALHADGSTTSQPQQNPRGADAAATEAESSDITNHSRKAVCGACGWYRTLLNTIAREGESLDSPLVNVIVVQELVHVVQQKGRRVEIDVPVQGWMSLATENGTQILRRDENATKSERDYAREHNVRLPNGSLDAEHLLETLKSAEKAQMQVLGQRLADKAIHKAAAGEKGLAHAAYEMDEEKVNSVAQNLKGTERAVEESVKQMATQVLDAPDAKTAVRNSELQLAQAATKEASKVLHVPNVSMPDNVPTKLDVPKRLPQMPNKDELHEAVSSGRDALNKEVGDLFR